LIAADDRANAQNHAMTKVVRLWKSTDGERGAVLTRSIATASRRINDAIANMRDDAIVRLFCPTAQRLHEAGA
jgi:hypothetical protein